MDFDLVSDLHIDRWGGQSVDWATQRRSDILVIAGDIADRLDETIAEIKRAASVYPTVLFIDGNHEHQDRTHIMKENRRALRTALAQIPNAHYLHHKSYIKDGVAFVGRNGWFDFAFGEPRSNTALCRASYEAARPGHKPDSNAILAQAKADARAMTKRVAALQKRDDVVSIVAVQHTLPHPQGISWSVYPKKDVYAGTYGSLAMKDVVVADKAGKIKQWVFGHNHDQKDFQVQHIRYISNPRGRPSDFNRINYTLMTLSVPSAAPPSPPAPGAKPATPAP